MFRFKNNIAPATVNQPICHMALPWAKFLNNICLQLLNILEVGETNIFQRAICFWKFMQLSLRGFVIWNLNIKAYQ